MSKQAAKDWMKKVFAEPDVARHVVGLKEEGEIYALAAEMGYEFTREEWAELASHVEGRARAYAAEHGIEISEELSDEELKAIAGGGVAEWLVTSVFKVIQTIVAPKSPIYPVGPVYPIGPVGGSGPADQVGQWVDSA